MKQQLDQDKYSYEQRQLQEIEHKERELLNKADSLDQQIHQDHDWNLMMRDRLTQFKL